MRYRTVVPVLLAALALTLAACGSSSKSSTSNAGSTTTAGGSGGKLIQRDAANASKPTITIGSKNFTEEFVLGNIYAQALQAAGYKVKTQLNLGSEQIAYKALRGGQISAYPEYTGTALTSFYKVQITDVPKDAQATYQLVKKDAAKQGVVALAPTPFTDSNGFAMTAAGAKQAGDPKTLSDLKAKAPALTIAGPPECRQREDCLLGLESIYGLHFKKFIPVDPAKRHEVLTSGQVNVSEVFTTDGQIKADNLVLLTDDKHMFPPYNATMLVRKNVLDAAGPDFAKVVEQVGQGLTTPVMQELNSRVDLDKEPPAQVASEYLKEAGYVK
ncbi:MAG TPA: glycine betaine ABC transporter substrate-binding protein [Solirubrobacteraceae bacterium]|nr:glycine betaine ABC transporter substrate-binding protein [Solirubrobacteraceae bacterium]